MQRKAVAAYTLFFVVMAVSAYSVIAVASAPPVDIEGESYAEGSSFTAAGIQHNVSEIAVPESSGGGHGGGGGSLSGEITYVDPQSTLTETLDNGSEVAFRDGTYLLVVENGTDGRVAVLTEQFDVEGRLAADDAVFNSTVESDGETFVRFRANDTLVPLEEYLPEPTVARFGTGDTMQYVPDEQPVDAEVTEVTDSSVSVQWTGPAEFERTLSEGANVTLADGETYLVHFPNDGEVTLTQDFQGYSESQARIDAFTTRRNGLWGVSIISGLAAVLLVGLGYMPIRG
jgi:hypothetical protein